MTQLHIPLDQIHTLKHPKELVLHSVLINDFYLSHSERSSLDKYYIHHWTGEYLKSQMCPEFDWYSEGVITHQDTSYIVICPDYLRKKYWKQLELKLSFRAPKKEFNIPPYVLIRESISRS